MSNTYYLLVLSMFIGITARAQTFPNPTTLSTGQGAQGTADPVWQVSEFWYATPPSPMGLNYTPALINANCAPGAWVDASTLPPPTNNGNWITGPDADCANNTGDGYRFFRLTLDLPSDCNGFSVTTAGNYVLSFDGYVDNQISEVYINGTPQGISGGSYAVGSQLTFTLNGPWLVGTNYVDVCVFNFPNGPGNSNPYGLLLVANTTAPVDTDGDGIANVDDLCPCDPGTNAVGCSDPANPNGCDVEAVRSAFAAAGCVEMNGCVSECSIYFLNPQSLSGSAAQTFAENLGANLVSVQSQAENDCIINSLNAMGETGVIWIGFNDEAEEGTFVWYDQSPVVYTNWAPYEPNNAGDEDCVQIYPDGMWNDLSAFTANAQSIIEVNLCPVVDAGPDIAICTGETAPLEVAGTLFGSPAYTYDWNNGLTGASNPVAPTATTSYDVLSTDRYGCEARDTLEVTVHPLPAVNGGNDQAVCPGSSVTLSGTGADSYVWDNGGVDGVAFTPATTLTYTVTGTDLNGCENTDQVLVTVHALPVVDAGPDQVVCAGDNVLLSGAGATSYSWNNAVTDGLAFAPVGTLTYTVTGTDANSCTNTDDVLITVEPLPDPSFVAGLPAGCLPMDIAFAPVTSAANFQWSFSDGTTGTSNGNVLHTFTDPGCYSVTLVITSPAGCVAQQTQTDIFCLPENPQADFSYAPVSPTMLNTSLLLSNTSVHADTYFWQFGDGTNSTLVAPTHTYPIGIADDYSLVLIAANALGCTDTALATIIVEEEAVYFIPNAFTPDGNEFNQVFTPVFSSGVDPQHYNLKIYNRWGELLFESNNPEIGWDGTAYSNPVQEGTYVWRIAYRLKDSTESSVIAGHVSLIR